jgi:hypothetical protein
MAVVEASYGFHFAQPLWLLLAALVVPVVWLAKRSLRQLNTLRRVAAVVLRVLVVLILVALLARPTITRSDKRMTLIAILDRSQSVPAGLQADALKYLAKALEKKRPGDQLAVVDVGEAAMIACLPSSGVGIPERNTTLTGDQTALAAGDGHPDAGGQRRQPDDGGHERGRPDRRGQQDPHRRPAAAI